MNKTYLLQKLDHKNMRKMYSHCSRNPKHGTPEYWIHILLFSFVMLTLILKEKLDFQIYLL